MSLGNILYTIILYPLVQIIEISYKIFDKLFSNTGLSVIGVSLTVTLLCLPLYIVAEKWQQVERDTQASMKAGIDRIKSTFKGDEQYMILSTFYRQHHYHPMMALRSSFGLLIQIPFFMAAYSCLSKMPALQGQGFLFIRDMGQQDALFTIGSFPVNVLPIAMTLINIIAGAIYTKGFSFREKAQIYGMALIFLVILYNSPSGLVLYWTMNNVFSLVKNVFYKLKHPVKVLYLLMSAAVLACGIYIIFIYDGGASMTKRLAAALPLQVVIILPLIIKGINWLITKPLVQLTEDKKLRTSLFLLSAVSLTILCGLVIPSSVISSSVQEFSNIGKYTNPNQLLSNPFWQAFGLFVFWASCVYFLFGKRIQTIIAVIFGCGLLCSIANTYVFAGNYGSMNITLKFIDGMQNPASSYILINLFVNAVLWAALFTLYHFKKGKIFNSLILISIVAFGALSIINISQTKKEYVEFAKTLDSDTGDSGFTTKFSLSKTEKNVIVLMLDRAESNYVEKIFSDYPNLKENFSGFTFYKNTVSYNGHTLMASPALYGGYDYTPDKINAASDMTLKEKHNNALMVLPKLFTEQADSNVYVSDLSWANYSYYADVSFFNEELPSVNAYKLLGRYSGDFKKEFAANFENTVSLSDNLERNLLFVSFFRSVPCAVRPALYYEGTWWASETASDVDALIDAYSELYYLNKITSYDSDKGNLLVITNDTTHANEDVRKFNFVKPTPNFNLNGYGTNTISYMAIARWIDAMKENGTYDNTKIIIVADHGIGSHDEDFDNKNLSNGYNKDHLNPVLFVKDFNAKGPMTVNYDFMTTADVPSLALKDIIENPVNPFTGNPIKMEKEDGVYITTDDLFMPYYSKSKNIFTVADSSWYKVRDNIFIDSNWTQEVPND